MNDGPIAREWHKFVKAVEIDDAPPNQLKEMRRAFYAGCSVAMQVMIQGLDHTTDEPTEADLNYVRSVKNELEHFALSVMLGRA
jgi:hypothetical protein